MKKLIVPTLVTVLLACAPKAEATSAGLAFAKQNLFNTQMRAYNAQIKYYQGASLHYLKKMPSLTALKYNFKLPAAFQYKMPMVNSWSVPQSTRLVMPTAPVVQKAVGAQSVSQLMSLLKGWGKY